MRVGIIFLSLCLVAIVGFSVTIQPAFAEKVISFSDSVDIRKENFQSVLSNLQDYPKIFPQYVKSVKTAGNGLAQINIAPGLYSDNIQVKDYSDSQGKFIVKALSGSAKGSKIVMTLTQRTGYDGTPNGGTTVRMDLTINVGFPESIVLGFVSDEEIRKGLDSALYDLENFAKAKYPQAKNPSQDVNTISKIKSAKMDNLMLKKGKI